MVKHLCLCLVLFGSMSVYCQTPFVQSNATKQKSGLTLDTTSLTLTEKLNEVSKSISTLSIASGLTMDTLDANASRKITDLSDALKKVNKEYDDIKTNREDLIKESQSLSESLSRINMQSEEDKKIIAALKKKVESLQKKAQSLETSLQNVESQKNDLQKKLTEAQEVVSKANYENFRVSNQNITLQVNAFNHQIEEIKTNIEDLSTQLNKVEESSIKLRAWREDKILVKEDDKEVLDYYTNMVLQNEKGKKIVENLKTDISTIEEEVKKDQKNRDKIDVIVGIGNNPSLTDTLSRLMAAQRTLHAKIAEKLENLGKSVSAAKKSLGDVQTEINNSQKSIAKIYKTYKTAEGSKGDLKTIAGITQPLGEQGKLVPNISLLGYRSVSDENSSRSAQLKLFVAPTAAEKSTYNSAYRLFIPEASSYGFLADFSLGFIPSDNSFKVDQNTRQPIKKLGINLGAYYLGKSMAKTDSSTFNAGMLQFKAGLQYIAIGKVLSFYANLNPFYLTDGIKDFEANYTYRNKLYAFVDFGLNAYLNLSTEQKQDGFFIDFDLGFISVGGDIKSLVPSSDPLIPRIKVSLVKGFSF